MTDRERWIVYPLLFMALGMSLKDKLSHSLRADMMFCKKLWVVDEDDQPLVELASDSDGGAVTAFRANSNFALTLGHRGSISSLFADSHDGTRLTYWPVLGNLQSVGAPRFPWLSPLLRSAGRALQPGSDAPATAAPPTAAAPKADPRSGDTRPDDNRPGENAPGSAAAK